MDVAGIAKKVQQLRSQYAERDGRMANVAAIRGGNMDPFGDLFPGKWPKPLVANMIDVAARDTSEMLAPLPTFTSVPQTAETAAAKRAEKITRICYGYITESRLVTQMYDGADDYFSNGFMTVVVEPDHENRRPRILIEDVVGGYPEFDRWGKTVSYTKVWLNTELELAQLFPQFADRIIAPVQVDDFGRGARQRVPSNHPLEVVRYHDKDGTILYIPERQNLVLAQTANPLGKCMVQVAKRPGKGIHGQYDDIIWVQLAKARFAILALEAAEKAVSAPIAVPDDVQDFPLGADALIRSANPKDIGRVPLAVPKEAFASESVLADELRTGARYPDSRTGNMNASVITGRGVQELQGGFDSQIKAAQAILEDVFKEVMAMMLELDETLWPNLEKTIRGAQDGTPYEIKYTPRKDIRGSYVIDVTYGATAGLDPNRALIFLLQGLGAELMSKSFVRRNLPITMNVLEEEEQITIEKLRDAAVQGVIGAAQAVPMMVQNGQDPTQLIHQMGMVIEAVAKGKSVEEAIQTAFAPQPPPEAPPGSEAPPLPGAPGQQAPGGGPGGGGLMQQEQANGVNPAMGGRPPIQQLLAGLGATGSPNLRADVKRIVPAA